MSVGARGGAAGGRRGRVSAVCSPQEGVPRQLLGQRQHGERPGGLQGGAESAPEGMKQPCALGRPGGGRRGASPFCFLSKLPTLETCFYYTRACNLRCFSEKTLAAAGTGGASGGWEGANCLPCPALGPEGPGGAVPCRGSVLVLPVLTSPRLKAAMLSGLAFQGFARYVGFFILGSSGKVAECISLSPGKAAGGARWDAMGGAGLPRPAARPAPGRQGDPETSPCLGFPTCKMGKAAPLYLTGVAVRLLWLTLCKAHQDLWVRGVQEATGSPQRVPAPGRLRCASLSPPVAQGSALGRPPGALHSTPSSQAEAHCECPALPLSCMRAWAGAAPTPPAPLAESLQGRKGFFLPNCF